MTNRSEVQPPFEAYHGDQPYVFASYAHRDSAAVFAELARLHALGYRIWYDEGIDPGNEWPENIAAALDRCALFLVFLSPAAVQSKNVQNEIYYALDADKPFLRVDLEEVTLAPGLKLRIGQKQAVMKYRMPTDRYERQMEKALPTTLRGVAPAGTPAEAPRRTAGGLAPWLIATAPEPDLPLTGLAPGSREARNAQSVAVVELGLPLEVRTRQCGLVFRLVPAGKFIMGSPPTEADRQADETAHAVQLRRPFYCGKFPVTQSQWQAVMGANPAKHPKAGPDAPVEQVSWLDCQDFLAGLARREGAPVGAFRLLTEAEWEYACRAGTQTPFCYGASLSGHQANFNGGIPYGPVADGPYLDTPVRVGQYAPNAFGLHDLHGNVWEWCVDWYGAYPSSTVTDPLGPPAGEARVLRGGSWFSMGQTCRAACRLRRAPDLRDHCFGLRVALALDQATG